jgi:hypothetical protein
VVRPPYQAAHRLCAIAAQRWAEIDAHAAQGGGLDPFSLRPDRFFNYIYAWAVDRVENREEWDALLILPLTGSKVVKPTAAALETEGADFMNFMGQMTG